MWHFIFPWRYAMTWKHPLTAAFASIWLAVLAAAAAAAPVEMPQVPPIAREAAGKAVPGISLGTASLIAERGQKVYVLQGTDTKGRQVSAYVTDQGQVLRVDTPIRVEEVPQVVTARLRARLKDFDPKTVWRSVRYGGESIWHVFDGTENNSPLRVEVESDGKRVLIVEPDATGGR
jgi:hypothetical protein